MNYLFPNYFKVKLSYFKSVLFVIASWSLLIESSLKSLSTKLKKNQEFIKNFFYRFYLKFIVREE